MDEAADLSRRIDDLLSGAIDEQVREQRVLAELMVGIRDGMEQLSEQVAALGEAVEAAREASERVQLAPAAGAPSEGIADRFESVETAIGELSATISALADRPDPVMLDPEEARALFGTTAEAARESAASEASALRELIESHITSLRDAALSETSSTRETLHSEMIAAREALLADTAAIKDAAEQNYAQLARRFAEAQERSDVIENRLSTLESSMEVVGKSPDEIKAALDEFRRDITAQNESLASRVQGGTDASSTRLSQAADRLTESAGSVTGGLDAIAARFQTLQESLLAYLQVRDIALEEERDRVITELLEEFARAVDAKQRPAFAAGMRGAWASRRDRRDARRFRMAEGRNLPRMPQVGAESIKAAAETLAKAPAPTAGPRPERRPPAPSPLIVDEAPRPRPVEVQPPPKAAKAKAKVVESAAKAKPAKPAAKPPAPKPAPVKAAKPKPAKAAKPPAAELAPEPDEVVLGLGAPAPAEDTLLESPPAPPPVEAVVPEPMQEPEPQPEVPPEAPEPAEEADVALMIGELYEAPEATEAEPVVSKVETAIGEPEALAPPAAEPEPAPEATAPRRPRPAKAVKAPKTPKAPEGPEDRKAAKLERAAKRRARQAAPGRPVPAPPKDEETPEIPAP
ncbi:MAG: hypothetical protein ABR548_00870 [Actinomycetota bacterium]|nr:hypothetical protein [Actinomycetota bacterium]